MSQENVEVVRRGNRLFELGDMEALAEIYDPDVVMRHPEDWPEPGPSVGREAVIDQFRGVREGWGETRLVEEEIEAAQDWVVVRFRIVTEGSGSGILTEQPLSCAYRLKESKIAEQRFSWSHARVLEDAGLSE